MVNQLLRDKNTIMKGAIKHIKDNQRICDELMSLRDYDLDTYYHAMRVAEISIIMALYMQAPKAELEHLAVGAILHDIGKQDIPKSILCKPDRLTPNDWVAIRAHPEKGYKRLLNLGVKNDIILNSVVQHHERNNGQGYPRGIKGNEISVWAKVLGTADVFEALTHKRHYKEAVTYDIALNIMRNSTELQGYESFVKVLSELQKLDPDGSKLFNL